MMILYFILVPKDAQKLFNPQLDKIPKGNIAGDDHGQ